MKTPEQTAAEHAALTAMGDLLRAYESAPSRRDVFDITWAAVRTRMECETMMVSCYDPADGLMRCLYLNSTHPPVDPSRLPPRPLDPAGRGTQSEVIRTKTPHLFDDFRTQFKTSETRYVADYVGRVRKVGPPPAPEDGQVPPSAIMVPFDFGRSRTGVLQVFSTHEDVYRTPDLVFVDAAAAAMSAAVRRLANGAD